MCLAGGKRFSTLDLTAAYQQMRLDEQSSKLVTIDTHKGLYQYTHMPFGIASAPAVFQRAMDTVIQGLPSVIRYLDDILVTGESDEKHVDNLQQLLECLQNHGVRLKREKCCFFQDWVEYLGHVISSNGVHTTPTKVQAVVDQPVPENVSQLLSFLGQVNYYAKFVPNLSSLLAPLHRLLKAGQTWQWSEACDRAFQVAKDKVTQAPVLAHFDPKLPVPGGGCVPIWVWGRHFTHNARRFRTPHCICISNADSG